MDGAMIGDCLVMTAIRYVGDVIVGARLRARLLLWCNEGHQGEKASPASGLLLEPAHLLDTVIRGVDLAGARFSLIAHVLRQEIGREACRDRVCQNVEISGVSVTLKKKHSENYY